MEKIFILKAKLRCSKKLKIIKLDEIFARKFFVKFFRRPKLPKKMRAKVAKFGENWRATKFCFAKKSARAKN